MRLLLALGIVSLLSTGQVTDLGDYFPTTAGLSWRYSLTKQSTITAGNQSRQTQKDGHVIDRVVEAPAPSTVVIHRTVNETNTTMGQVTVESKLRVAVRPDSVAVVAVGIGAAAPVTRAVPQPLLLQRLPGPMIEGVAGVLELVTQLRSQSISSVEVPAGTFEDCVLAETTGTVAGTANGMPVREGTITIKSWYAKAVGLVREDRTLRFTLSGPEGVAIKAEEVTVKALTSFERP